MNNDKSIYACYEEIKQREIRELKAAIKMVGGEFAFKRKPIVMVNRDGCYPHPCDVCITSVEMSDDDLLTIRGYESGDDTEEIFDVDLVDIAYGHISFITEAIPVRTFSQETFSISRLSREDLEARGFDASDVDDKTMQRLAEKLGDDYCEQLFWSSLEILAECFGIPRKEEEDDEEEE